MANSKISALTSATTPLAGTETLPVVQSSTTKQVSVANLTAARAVSVGSLTSDGDLSFSANALYLKGKTSGGTSTRLIGINSGNTVYIGSIDTQAAGGVIFINGTQFMGVDTSSNVTFNVGNLVQGAAAKGINFTANTPAAGMTSQLLNWYEEGTWTPTMTFSVSQGDLTYGVQTGRYTRIGRVVVLNCFVRVTETTASGNITITGLPFTNSGAISAATACFIDNLSGVSGAVMAQINAASSTITLYYTGTGSSTQLSNTNTGTNSSFQFVLNYIV